jgi:hypothetical protein
MVGLFNQLGVHSYRSSPFVKEVIECSQLIRILIALLTLDQLDSLLLALVKFDQSLGPIFVIVDKDDEVDHV